MRLLVLFSFSIVFCFAQIPSYNKLLQAPKGLAKDYYIYRYAVEKRPNKDQLKTLREQIYRYQGIIKKKFDNVLGAKKTQACPKDIKAANLTCQKDMLRKNYLSSLDSQQIDDLAQFFKTKDRDMFVLINSFNQAQSLKYIINEGSLWAFYRYLLDSSTNIAAEVTKWSFTPSMWNKLNNSYKFQNILNEAVILNKYPLLKHWLVELNANNLQGNNAFLCGLNAILLHKDQKAFEFFLQASKTAPNTFMKDASLFWLYLISKDENHIILLSQSTDINMYSLYAKELFGTNEISVEIPNPQTKTLANYNISDPFTWQKTRNEANKLKGKDLEDFAQKFYTKSTLGEYSLFMERASNFKKHYFPLPFIEYIGTNDITRQALILAIARQESRFIPSAVSTSYALGMMQFIPFLARDIGYKKLKIANFEEDDLFKPDIAYKFANYHLDYLEKYLKSPIFIAYAYNGGLGFTKRMLLANKLFNQNSDYKKYEPFLSLELVPYSESRTYAKKVLANYVVYSAILGSNIKISQFFENLTQPGIEEYFRK